MWAPKEGVPDSQYEDAYTGQHLTYAIADGAASGYLSGLWARHLVEAFTATPSGRRADEILDQAVATWQPLVDEYVATRNAQGRPLKWYEDAKLEQGAFATVLAIRFRLPGRLRIEGHWAALSIGDACAFQVRRDRLVTRWPLDSSDGFGTSPQLVRSAPSQAEPSSAKLQKQSGSYRHGDRFYLMTDAMAAWFLLRYEEGEYPWLTLDPLLDVGHEQKFRSWIGRERRLRRLRNDDVTVARVNCGR